MSNPNEERFILLIRWTIPSMAFTPASAIRYAMEKLIAKMKPVGVMTVVEVNYDDERKIAPTVNTLGTKNQQDIAGSNRMHETTS